MAVHHITNEHVADCPKFEEWVGREDFQRLLDENILVAHNAKFDVDILTSEGAKVGKFIDTLKVAKTVYKDLKAFNLQYLRYKLELKIDEKINPHDAESDVIVLEKLFIELLSAFPMSEMESAMSTHEELVTRRLDEMLRITQEPLLLKILPFGKYREKTFEEVLKIDRQYLEWLNRQTDLDEDLKFTLDNLYRKHNH